MSYTTIAGAIVTILNGISDIQQVLSDPNAEITKYPCAILTTMGHEDSYLDTTTNDRKYEFMITLMFRTDTGGNTEAVLRDLASLVVSTLEANVALSGACDILMPTSAKWGWDNRDIPRRIVEITVEVRKREQR